MATEDTHDILIENKKVVNNLRQIKAKYAVDDTDKVQRDFCLLPWRMRFAWQPWNVELSCGNP